MVRNGLWVRILPLPLSHTTAKWIAEQEYVKRLRDLAKPFNSQEIIGLLGILSMAEELLRKGPRYRSEDEKQDIRMREETTVNFPLVRFQI